MAQRFRLLVICLLTFLFLVPCAQGAVSAEDRQKAFAWFDSLGYPPIEKYTFARIYDGQWTELVDRKRKPSYDYGFITRNDTDHFTVVRFSLWTEKFAVSPATAQKERVYFEPVALENYARNQIKIRTNTRGYTYPTDLKWPVEFFLLARACEAKGQSDLSAKLCDLADKEMDRPEPGKPTPSFQERIADEIARYEIWRLVLDFEDIKISRETLLHRFDAFLQHFPNGTYLPLATDMSKELRRMVKEEQDRNALPPSGEVTEERRIADLVFALRDQNGRQWSQPGACDIFEDPRGENSPASQLVKIGLPAVPALLEVMTDSRLTRSVSYWRNYVFSHHVLPVGDVAQIVMEKIAGRRFESNLDWKKHPLWSEQAAATQVAARMWWSKVQSQGEAALLAEAVQQGNDMSVGAAEKLVALYPDVALPALTKGIAQASAEEDWQGLVKAAGNLQSLTVLPLLEKQMREGRDLGTRVQAAIAMNKRNGSSAITCMENEWRRLKEEDGSQEDLCLFLIEHGTPESIRLLGEGLLTRKEDARFAVVAALDNSDRGAFGLASKASARAIAMQRVLVGLLQDKAVCKGRYFGFGETRLEHPRICDAANFALAHFWPDRYQFQQSASLFDRDRECILMQNRWRTANGMSNLPLPARPAVPRAKNATLRALLARWAHATSPRQRARLGMALEEVGLAAIPAVRAARKQEEGASPTAQDLLLLEKRLSCIVREVRIETKGFVIGPAERRRLNQLKGLPFTATACADLITYFMRRLPAHASGVRLYAYRDNDGTGFIVHVSFLRATTKYSRSGFRLADNVSAGSVSVLGSGGSASASEEEKRFGMEEVGKAIQEALGSRPDTPISIEIEREFDPESP